MKKGGFSFLPKQDKGIIQTGSHKSFVLKAENSDKRDEWLEMLQKESSLSPMAVALRRRRLSTEVFNYTKELVPLTPDAGTPLAGNYRMSSECGLNTISTDNNNIAFLQRH